MVSTAAPSRGRQHPASLGGFCPWDRALLSQPPGPLELQPGWGQVLESLPAVACPINTPKIHRGFWAPQSHPKPQPLSISSHPAQHGQQDMAWTPQALIPSTFPYSPLGAHLMVFPPFLSSRSKGSALLTRGGSLEFRGSSFIPLLLRS